MRRGFVSLMTLAWVAESAADEAVPEALGLAAPVYAAEFFAPFRPLTALDMLMLTPGFTLLEGNDLRGFAATASNVLIDGRRPAVKSGGIEDVLQRMPAVRVVRIELLLGGTAAEAQGQTLVANIVSSAATARAGTVSGKLERTSDGRVAPTASVSYASPLGRWDSAIELTSGLDRYPAQTLYRIRNDAGVLVESERERQTADAPEFGVAGSLTRARDESTVALNGRLNWDRYGSMRATDVYAGDLDAPAVANRAADYEETGSVAELGVDWRRGLRNDWSAKLIGLGSFGRSEVNEDYRDAANRGLSTFGQRSVEALVRAAYERDAPAKFAPELGVELAYNRVANRLRFARDSGAGLEEVAVGGADARVSEVRAEAFFTGTVELSSKLRAELGGAYELSQIEVSGDAASRQRLAYFKPSASLLWSIGERFQLRADLRRTVDQLDFTDFAASVDQVDDRTLGGNAELRPARITRGSMRAEYRWSAKGAVSAEIFQYRYDGLLGYLVLPSGEEALGTIGDGRLAGITTRMTLPFDWVLRGAQLTFDATFRDSSLADPITGLHRRMDEIADREIEADFRHDVPGRRFSWGLRVAAPRRTQVHYVGEVLEERDNARWSAYFQTTWPGGLKATLDVDALNGADTARQRRFFAGTRAGTLAGSEQRDRREGKVISIEVSRLLGTH